MRDLVVRHEEDVVEVLERLRDSSEPEVRLVVPSRSMLADSPFNFQLLALQAEQSGLRLVVESEDERALALAVGAGLEAHDRDRTLVPVPVPGQAPTGAAMPHASSPVWEEYADDKADPADQGDSREGARAHPRPPGRPRFGPWRPEQSTAVAARRRGRRGGHGRRLILYGAAATILLAGVGAAAVSVPSATVTIRASAQGFSTAVDLTAQPGSPAAGITVRAESIQKKISGVFPASGQRNTPGAEASGSVQYQNSCATSLSISQGAILTSRSGVDFVQQKTVTVAKGGTQVVPIHARLDGSNGNLPPGQITTLQNAGTYASCLKVSNPKATTGGKDAKHQLVVTEQDLAAAQAQLEQQAKREIESELAADLRSGEKQSDQNQVLFGTPAFTPDHPAGSMVEHFDATLSLSGTSAYYRPAQVSSAFWSALEARVPAGQQLTRNEFSAQYQTTAGAGGRLEFKGTATGRIAPRLDLDSIRTHLAGHSMGSAEAYLRSLPGTQASITEQPFPLPLLPLLKSRIAIEYVIQQPPAPAASPGEVAGGTP